VAWPALATHACRQSSYLRPVPAAPKPAILILTSFATEAGRAMGMGHAQRYGRTNVLPRLHILV